ncbi:hypothetical protein [Brumicola nitratireducens]|uniref:Uncharacterized protein n=1 Tax=Glaciecola nitratireducens (strain JCM 12485 / KCTC 12276 / FR1064) TaxID=1085623 RepID=G4QL49_GLANF|nr:hypothetical protein [Glaciecola nitratireducens]AEP29520.1 hypothetical protein GNIT_1401 [Glaciecola nitratireducens FR1064]
MTNSFCKLMIINLAFFSGLFISKDSFSKMSSVDTKQEIGSNTMKLYSSDELYGPAANFLVNSELFSEMQKSLKADSFVIVDTETLFIGKLSTIAESVEGVRFKETLRCDLTICMGSFNYASKDEMESVLSQFSSISGLPIALVAGFVEIDKKQVANVLFHYRGNEIIEDDISIK